MVPPNLALWPFGPLAIWPFVPLPCAHPRPTPPQSRPLPQKNSTPSQPPHPQHPARPNTPIDPASISPPRAPTPVRARELRRPPHTPTQPPSLTAALPLSSFALCPFAICHLPFPMSTVHFPLPTVLPPDAPRRNARIPADHPPPPDPSDLAPQAPSHKPHALLNHLARVGFSLRELTVSCDLSATDILDFVEDPEIDDQLGRLEAALQRTLKLRLLDAAITAADELEKIAIAATEHPTERRRAATTLLRAAVASSNPKPSGTGVPTVRTTSPGGPGVPPVRPPLPLHTCLTHPTTPTKASHAATSPPPSAPSAPPREQRPAPNPQPPSLNPQAPSLDPQAPPLTFPSAARSPAGSPPLPPPCAPSSARAARLPPARPPPPARARTRSA